MKSMTAVHAIKGCRTGNKWWGPRKPRVGVQGINGSAPGSKLLRPRISMLATRKQIVVGVEETKGGRPTDLWLGPRAAMVGVREPMAGGQEMAGVQEIDCCGSGNQWLG